MCGLVSLTLLAFAAFPAQAQNQLWITQFGTSNRDIAWALAPDGAGGVMIAGETTGDLGGPSAGGWDAFLARYDSAGRRLWLLQFGTSEWEKALALAPDGAGGVMVAGWTEGSLGGPNAGFVDAFLARYDGAGNRLWIRQFGTNRRDNAYALVPDGAGGVMVAGETFGSLGGPISNSGSPDTFLARYDSEGNELWIRQFGSGGGEIPTALAPDGAGGVMIAGYTGGSLGGPNAGSHDAWIARYDGAGTRLWITQFGTSVSDSAQALAPDGAGGVIVAGSTNGSLGGPRAGFNFPDAFMARYDSEGNQTWILQFGTVRNDFANALATDGAGAVMVAGNTGGNLGCLSAGGYDVFLARHAIDFCYADCNQSTGVGVLDLLDFFCFGTSFILGEPYACDCDTSTGPGVCDLLDFLCFQNAFVAGCP